jgi:hypothetical protein
LLFERRGIAPKDITPATLMSAGVVLIDTKRKSPILEYKVEATNTIGADIAQTPVRWER